MGIATDSAKMTLSLNEEKAEHIVMKIKKFLKITSPILREPTLIIGSAILVFLSIFVGNVH